MLGVCVTGRQLADGRYEWPRDLRIEEKPKTGEVI
jgi:hypothetical protein